MREYSEQNPFRILSLDGGGAKGFYTLGVLQEIEAMIECPIHEKFDLIFGTSTGAIIASLLSLGWPVKNIVKLYEDRVSDIFKTKKAAQRSAKLKNMADEIFGNAKFEQMKTFVGIVTTNWHNNEPKIFKKSREQAHGRDKTFLPGFGALVAEAVQASCSAIRYFERKCIVTASGTRMELIDGGFCANNPTLYAIAEAEKIVGNRNFIRVVSLGVGRYPAPKMNWIKQIVKIKYWAGKIFGAELISKTLDINSESMNRLRVLLFGTIPTIRIDEAYTSEDIATDMFETGPQKLNMLLQRGAESFAKYQTELQLILK